VQCRSAGVQQEGMTRLTSSVQGTATSSALQYAAQHPSPLTLGSPASKTGFAWDPRDQSGAAIHSISSGPETLPLNCLEALCSRSCRRNLMGSAQQALSLTPALFNTGGTSWGGSLPMGGGEASVADQASLWRSTPCSKDQVVTVAGTSAGQCQSANCSEVQLSQQYLPQPSQACCS
jgi:hypothetical protein